MLGPIRGEGLRPWPALPAVGPRSPFAVAVLLAGLLAVQAAVLGAPREIAGAAGPAPARMAAHGTAGSATGCGPAWGTGWIAAPQAVPGDPAFGGATLRLVVHPQLTGSQVRLRLSNAYGEAPLTIGAASVARVTAAAAVQAGTLRPVTFGGHERGVIPAGRDLLSDPVPLVAEAGRALAVSLFLPVAPRVGTVHPVALQTSYLSGPGDFTGTPGAGPFARRLTSWPLLTGLDVLLPRPTNAVVAIGDSITDGYGSKADTDQRWTDALSRRLADAGGTATMAVLNAGLSTNQLLADDPWLGGASPEARFDRDVAAATGATDVVLHIGTNDIAAGRTADALTTELGRFADRARAAGLRVFLTTITPSRTGPHGTRAAVATRTAVNNWVRTHGRDHADGIFDFAAAVADRSAPTRLAAAYDSGDGLHLSAAGYRAVAAAVDVGALTGSPCRDADQADARVVVSGR